MTLEEFKKKYFMERHPVYYSRYDIVEKGFAFQDATPFSNSQIKKEYENFLTDKKNWLKKYKW